MMIDDQDFEKLLAEKQEATQREKLNRLLEKLAASLQQSNNSRLDVAIQNLQKAIEQLIEAQKNPPVPSNNLEQETALQGVVEELRNHTDTLSIKRQWEITFKRDNAGYLQSPITFTQK